MFKRARYAISVNAALAKIGINPNHIDRTYRQGMQEMGMADGATPEEVAVFIFYQLPIGLRPDNGERIAEYWKEIGRVRQEVIEEAKLERAVGSSVWLD